MKKLFAFPIAILSLLGFVGSAGQVVAQDYSAATGNPTFGLNIPVENGFINVSNGNLHLEIPIATHTQRGALRLNERFVYDSKIWQIVRNGGYSWQPTNVPNSMAGWRFMTGGEAGITTITETGKSIPCDGNNAQLYTTRSHLRFAWVDPSGTAHPFDAGWTTMYSDCDIQPVPESTSGWATDASGYSIQASGYNDASPENITVWDNNGNIVNTDTMPSVIDRYGNYFSADSNGNLIDDLGLTPVVATQDGNVTYYDVLAPNGPINNNGTRVRYTVTTEPIAAHTAFNQSAVAEFPSGTLTAIKSIQLPDGSSYQFGYDTTGYGELTSITLPTGGTIAYGYTNYLDSYQNQNRWLTSRTVGSDPPMTFTPMVLTQCSSGGTGCQEQVTLHKPSGDETVYQLTLNNGAWNTSTTVYQGAVANNNKLATSTTDYDFSQACPTSVCTGSAYIKKNSVTTTLDNGLISKIEYGYDNPQVGKITSIKQWDYYTGTPSTTPTREIDYHYTGFDLDQVTELDANGNQAAKTTYAYTTSATQTSNVPSHGVRNAGGPYLQSVSRWLLDTNTQLTTSYVLDDTGMTTSVTDPSNNPPGTTSYQCGNTLPYQSKNPLGHITTYTYDCNSRAIINVKGPNDGAAGAGTSYQYEAVAGKLQTVTYPDSGSTTYAYPSATEVDTSIAETPSQSISTQKIVDAFGRPYQTIRAGISTETTYDSNGRPYCTTNPHLSTASSSTDGTTCISTYDGLDRPKVQTLPDNNTLTWSYSGNTVTSTDENQNSWQRTSDVFGQLTAITEPGNLTSTYKYNALGNLLCVDQWGDQTAGTACSSGRVRTFTYDSLSRLITSTSPEAGTTCNGAWASGSCVNGYDSNGNILVRTDARGAVTNYRYDALNRMISKTYSGSGAAKTASSCYQYDNATRGIGLLSAEWTQSGSSCPASLPSSGYLTRRSIVAYDAMGRIKQEQQCHGSACTTGTPFSQTLNYDLAGNRTSYTNGIGSLTFSNAYDAAGRLQGVGSSWYDTAHPSSLLYVNSFSPTGAVVNATVGLGIYITNTYDNRLRFTGTTVEHP